MITEKGSSVREFAQVLRGEVVLPDNDGYDEIRRVFNGMIDRRPALIARCLDTQDVVRCVLFAREHDLLVSVRGGGHSVAGHGVCDGGLMIDLSLMKGVEVDAENRVAKAEPGLRLGEFIVETEKYGLVSPTGTVSDTGLAGLTLGGGYGYLSGKYGLALDNLLSAEVVTADGRVLRASADEHPDLYWALRGGSGNFGVVTSFELKLHPVVQVLGGMVIHPFERAGEVLRFYREVAASAPDELTTYAALATTPDGHQAVAITPCYCGPIEEGERILAPIRAFGEPIADLIRPMKYSEMNTLIDAANPPGMQNYWKGNLLRELSDGAIDAIVERAARVPSPRTVVLIDQLHGAVSRVAPSETAHAHRDTLHGVMTMSMWEDPADAETNIAWTRGLSAAIEPFASGAVYVNGAYEQRPFAAYGANYDRLVQIKTAYDPTNFFCHNQNIRPKARSGAAY
ncbi:MAG: FAD-binding oxidoreductase [Rubrobacter sp.]